MSNEARFFEDQKQRIDDVAMAMLSEATRAKASIRALFERVQALEAEVTTKDRKIAALEKKAAKGK